MVFTISSQGYSPNSAEGHRRTLVPRIGCWQTSFYPPVPRRLERLPVCVSAQCSEQLYADPCNITKCSLPLLMPPAFLLVFVLLFTATHEMQTRSSDENSDRLSVCLVCQTCGLWQNGRKIRSDCYTYERSFCLVFWKKNGWWGRPLLHEILSQPASAGVKSPILNPYSLV